MQNTLSVLSALSEPTRLKALLLLWDGKEHCTCELMKLLGKSQSCTSRHMATLKKAGLVVSRQDAQWVRYTRNRALPKTTVALVKAAIALIESEGPVS